MSALCYLPSNFVNYAKKINVLQIMTTWLNLEIVSDLAAANHKILVTNRSVYELLSVHCELNLNLVKTCLLFKTGR